MGTLDGKIAVVTGGGSGIGLGIAERFAEEGAQLVLVGRQKERLDREAQRLGGGAIGIAADVGDESQVKAVFDQLDRVDLVVTCAGGAVFGTIDGLPSGEWKSLFEGRFFGQIHVCHHAVPKMPEGGVILLCSGIAAEAYVPEYSGGAALCGAVNALGKNLAVELAPRGIRVNVISPGLIEGTDIKNNLPEAKLAAFWEDTVGRIPARRAGTARDTADAAHFLATCGYASGIVIDVDGGWTAT